MKTIELQQTSEIQQMSIEDIAYECGYDVIQTTSESSGYPSKIKPAIVGFDTFEEAQEIAEKYDLSIECFEKRDGWDLWYRNGRTASEAFELNDDTFGNNYSVYYKDDMADFEEQEINQYLDDLDEDDKEEFIAKKMEILDHLKNLGEDEAVLVNEGEFDEVIKIHVMTYHEDATTSVIGLIKR